MTDEKMNADNNEMKHKTANKIKIKNIRKWSIVALVIIICIFAASRFSIEPANKAEVSGTGTQSEDVTMTGTEDSARQGDEGASGGSLDGAKAGQSEITAGGGQSGAAGSAGAAAGSSKDSSSSSSGKAGSTKSGKTGEGGAASGSSSQGTDTPSQPQISDGAGGGTTEPKPEPETFEVTYSIDCKSLSQDMSQLTDKSVEPYIPKDGVILPQTTLRAKKTTSVFDLLNEICKKKNIPVDSSYTPMFDSYYVKGINYLYEKMAGSMSGWMYRVNGIEPNYGSSAYMVKPGDKIEWFYYCG